MHSTAMIMSAVHSVRCTDVSTFSGRAAMPESLPSHLAQNKNVAAEPNARMMISPTHSVFTKLESVAHFAMSMPKGATNITMMPAIMKRARRGMRSKSRSMASISRLPM